MTTHQTIMLLIGAGAPLVLLVVCVWVVLDQARKERDK